MNTESGKIPKGPRACATCARAKSRCVPGPEGRKCERCQRLDKPCSSQTPAPPRKRKAPRPTRVAELERKLEDLTTRVALAGLRQDPGSDSVSADPPSPADGFPLAPRIGFSCVRKRQPSDPFRHIFPPDKLAPVDPVGPPTPGPADAVHAQALSSLPSPPDPLSMSPHLPAPLLGPPPPQQQGVGVGVRPPPPLLWPDDDEAEALLDEYRASIAQLFPFAVVPPGLTAHQMLRDRPFFWKAFMVEACRLDGPRQMALGDALLRDVAEAALIRPQRTLDLLQGLQLLISLYHYNMNSFQMTNLLFLARSMCVSLGFHESQSAARQTEYSSAVLEQMRAFAGTYYLVTVIFTTTKKPDALMNTSQLEACCRVLEQRIEYPTDELLVGLVRAQQLAQSISTTLALRRAADAHDAQLPLSIVVRSFRQQLEAFKESLPPHIKDNPSIVGHRHVAEVLLYEIGLQTSSSTTGPGLSPTEQLELLWCCLHAAKAFIANRFACRPSPGQLAHSHCVCMSSFDFLYVFLICIRLITFDAPGWDLPLVRRELGFDELVERQIIEMESVAESRRQRRFRRNPAGQSRDSIAMAEGATANTSVRQGTAHYGAAVGEGAVGRAGGREGSGNASRESGEGCDGQGQGECGTQEEAEEPQDPFDTLARKLRYLIDVMGSGIDGVYRPSLAAAAQKVPMTVLDATHEIAQQLENSLWQDLVTVQDWNAHDLVPFTAWLY